MGLFLGMEVKKKTTKKNLRRELKAAEIFSLFSLTEMIFFFLRPYYATQLPERTWPISLDY